MGEVDMGCGRSRDNGQSTVNSEDLQIQPDIPNSSNLAILCISTQGDHELGGIVLHTLQQKKLL